MFSFLYKEDNSQKAYERLTFKHSIGKQALKYTLCTMGSTNKKVCLCLASNQQTQSDRIGWFQYAGHEKHIQKGTLKFIHISNFCDIEGVNYDPHTKVLLIQTADSLIGNENFHFQNAFVGNKWFEDIDKILKKKLENSCEHLLANEQNNEISINSQQLGTRQDLIRIRTRVHNMNKQEITKYIFVKEKSFLIQQKNLIDERDQNNKKIEVKQYELQKFVQILEQNERKLALAENKIKQQDQKIEQQKKQIDQMLKTIQDLKKSIEQKQRLIKQCQHWKQKYDQSLRKIEQTRIGKQQLFSSFQQEKRELSANAQKTTNLLRQFEENIKLLRIQQLFENEALKDQFESKNFLINSIQEFTKKPIKFTKLLCFLDPLNKTNVHKYIDKVPNICLVIRTTQQHLLAGFSMKQFSKQTPAVEGGILISMTKQKTYQCRENKRAITYDDFYIIFGNSQIRVRTGETELFSNMGIATAYYDNRGDKVTELIGPVADRTATIINYELYQIIFE